MLHTIHKEIYVVYFCTITCYQWLSLFQETETYSSVYRWFEHLRKDGCHVVGYVIMPNHLHALLYPTNEEKTLNDLVGEGKRFTAYDVVNSLKRLKKSKLLSILENGVEPAEKFKRKKHQVFRPSFDARECYSEKMIEQKLDYIHHNPVQGKWDLVDDFTKYEHSSAAFYELGEPGKFAVSHYKDLPGEGFSAPKSSESSDE